MKRKIIELLKSGQTVSGETLSRETGVTRVSVWKHIKDLKQRGYGIASSAKGYTLGTLPDVVFPWEFEQWENKIHYYPKVDSTMDIARELAVGDCPDFTIVVSDQQEKGRGRLRRTWHSQTGGLYFTLILRPDIPLALSSRVSILASVTMVQVLRNTFNIDAKVKWPNDILVDDKKLSGMLAEMEAETDRVRYINIGMGINVNNHPVPDEPNATSIQMILGKVIMRKTILKEFLDRFKTRMKMEQYFRIVDEWKRLTVTLGRDVKIINRNETSEGKAVDIDKNGALVLKLKNGTLKKIVYGDCFHV